MSAAKFVRAARHAAGIDQRELARRSKTSQSQLSLIEGGKQTPTLDTIERVLRGAGRQLIAINTIRDDASTIASEIKSALDSENLSRANRLFIQLSDNLAAEHGATRFALTIAEPEPTGSKRWDAALASVVAHWLTEEGLPVPEWASSPGRSLRRSWLFGSTRVEPPVDRVPEEFRRRRVLIDRDTLVSA